MQPSVIPPYINANVIPGKDQIFYSGPVWNQDEVEAGCTALREGKWLSSGEQVQRFERLFSSYFNHKSSLMVNSGSSANLIMLTTAKKFFGWPDGGEIITSVVGFATTVAPIVQCGLRPVFCDIEMQTLNFSIEEIEKKITPDTTAILISPVLGNPSDMDKIVKLALEHGLVVLLDGCDSLGSKYKGKYLSDYAFATSCSFFPAHHITTGEGGMVSSQNDDFIKLARKFAFWGRDCFCIGAANALPKGTCGKRFNTWLGDEVGVVDHKYVFTEIGYNLKPLDLQGAIGIVQLEKFRFIHDGRRRIKERIGEFLRVNRPDLFVPSELEGAETSWFGIPIICPTAESKQKLVTHLESAKIQTRNYFAGNILLHPGYSHLGVANQYPNANEVLKRVFFIGCHPTYSEEVLKYIEQQLWVAK